MPRIMITEVAYRVLKKADLVLCTLVPQALARCRIPTRKIVLLTNGVELRNHPLMLASDGNGDKVFEALYVGAVLRIRGVDTMLAACRLVLERLPMLKLSLVGPSAPEDREWLDRRVAELGLGATVSITGELPHEEVLRRVHEADICLFPFPKNYATEFIYPIKVLEYMGAGRTVIASDLAGVRRIIEDGRSGILVEPDNPKALADAIYLLWSRPELRGSLAANARAATPRFEWRRINGQMLEALHLLLQEPQ
ncbi:MAG: glycosyltransferase [Candidatus Acidiferrales bacterium]